MPHKSRRFWRGSWWFSERKGSPCRPRTVFCIGQHLNPSRPTGNGRWKVAESAFTSAATKSKNDQYNFSLLLIRIEVISSLRIWLWSRLLSRAACLTILIKIWERDNQPLLASDYFGDINFMTTIFMPTFSHDSDRSPRPLRPAEMQDLQVGIARPRLLLFYWLNRNSLSTNRDRVAWYNIFVFNIYFKVLQTALQSSTGTKEMFHKGYLVFNTLGGYFFFWGGGWD